MFQRTSSIIITCNYPISNGEQHLQRETLKYPYLRGFLEISARPQSETNIVRRADNQTDDMRIPVLERVIKLQLLLEFSLE